MVGLRFVQDIPDSVHPSIAEAYADAKKVAQQQELNLVKYVIHSLSEGDATPDCKLGAFWSNEDGWGGLETATLFSTLERMDRFLPISAGSDSEWMLLEEARDQNRKLLHMDDPGAVCAGGGGQNHLVAGAAGGRAPGRETPCVGGGADRESRRCRP